MDWATIETTKDRKVFERQYEKVAMISEVIQKKATLAMPMKVLQPDVVSKIAARR